MMINSEYAMNSIMRWLKGCNGEKPWPQRIQCPVQYNVQTTFFCTYITTKGRIK